MAERFGRYWLHEKIGHGGMAEVFRATIGPDPHTYAFDLAIKRLHAGLERDQSQIDQFLTEADVAKFLLHPNLVKVYEAGLTEGRAYIAMEYVWGHDLAKILASLKTKALHYPAELAVWTTLQLLKALDYVHRAQSAGGVSMGLVHRDVTPSNVYLTYNGEVKLGDFGVARVAFMEPQEDKPLVHGKVAYLSPEVLRGEPAGQEVDLFGAAATLYEMLTGQRPYEGASDDELMHGVVPERIPAPHQVYAEINRRLSNIVARALSPKPKKRPNDALMFYRELKLYLRESDVDVDPVALSRFVREVGGAAPEGARHASRPGSNDFVLPEYQVPVGHSPTQRFEALARQKRARWLPVLVAALLSGAGVGVAVYLALKPAAPSLPPVVPKPAVVVTPPPVAPPVVVPPVEPPKPEPLAAELAIGDVGLRVKALLKRAGVEADAGHREVAVEALLAAVAAKPTLVSARLSAARLLVDLKRYSDAEAQLNAVLEGQPKNGAAYLVLGEMQQARGDRAQAQWAFKKALAVEPSGKVAKAARKALKELP